MLLQFAKLITLSPGAQGDEDKEDCGAQRQREKGPVQNDAQHKRIGPQNTQRDAPVKIFHKTPLEFPKIRGMRMKESENGKEYLNKIQYTAKKLQLQEKAGKFVRAGGAYFKKFLGKNGFGCGKMIEIKLAQTEGSE
jgi:hypothetical protein